MYGDEETPMGDRLGAAEKAAFHADVIDGLSGDRKSLPCKWLYDYRGSELFEEITELDEYYPTRTEIGLLEAVSPALGDVLPSGAWVIEFGSGSSRKSDLLLAAMRDLRGYVPIDVAGDFLETAAGDLADRFPDLDIHPVAADFTQDVVLPEETRDDPKVGFFPGSTIGNFDPGGAVSFLSHARRTLGDRASMVVGVDLKKNVERLISAYDDSRGVTAAFNLNLLHRINRELDGGFDLDSFRHHVRYDADEGRIEMHLESLQTQTIRVDGHVFSFDRGETIHTENSYKYSLDGFAEVADSGGWSTVHRWTDSEELFSVHLLAAA